MRSVFVEQKQLIASELVQFIKSRSYGSGLQVIMLAFLVFTNVDLLAQVCNPAGNVMIYSNHDGGVLQINVDQDIPNLKIGVVSYESPVVSIIGPFVANVVEVIYAGYGAPTGCSGVPDPLVFGVDPDIVTIYTTAEPAIVPFLGDPQEFPDTPPLVNCVVGATGCTDNSLLGFNSSNQLVQFFLSEFAAPAIFYGHLTDFDCWEDITFNVSEGGNCCLEDANTPANPIYVVPATYDLIPETEFSLCTGPVVINIPYEVLFEPPAYPGYVWSNGETGPSITITEPGVYSVTVGDYCHNPPGNLLTDQFTVLPCDEFFVTIDPLTLCLGDEGELNANIFGGVPPFTYVWTPNIGIGPGPHFIFPDETTIYSVEVTDNDGATATATVEVEVIEEIFIVDLGPDQELCEPQIVLDATTDGAFEYFWSTGDIGPQLVVTEPGFYFVDVFGICGNGFSEISITECTVIELSVSLGNNQSICPGESLLLTANVQGGTPPYTFSWTPNLGNSAGPFNVTPTTTTTYTVVVTDTEGNSAQASKEVQVLTEPITAAIIGPSDLCNAPIQLNAATPGGVSYQWNTGQSAAVITVNTPGTYTVTVFGQCSQATASVEIEECFIPLSVSLGNNITRCQGESFTLTAEATGGVPPYSYTWSPDLGSGPGPFTLNVQATTSYSVVVFDSDGEVATAQVTVSIAPEFISVNLGPDITACRNSPVILNATTTGALGYLWSTGATGPTINVTSQGNYWVRVDGLCTSAFDTVGVTLLSGNLPNFPREIKICDDTTVVIGPVLGEGYGILWDTGETTPQIEVNRNGFYSATVSSVCGESTFSVVVNAVNCRCDIYVPNAFTPFDANGINDLFGPVTLCPFLEYEFTILDRWGEVVFTTNNLKDKWNGHSPNLDYFGGVAVFNWKLVGLHDTEFGIPKPVERQGHFLLIK